MLFVFVINSLQIRNDLVFSPLMVLGHTVFIISAVEKKPLNFVVLIIYRQCLNQNKCKRSKAEVIYV